MSWNVEYHNPSWESTSSVFNRASGALISYGVGASLPGGHVTGSAFAVGSDFLLNNEAVGKFCLEAAVNNPVSLHVGGGPVKTISHSDGTKTIISYSGCGVDAE